jgi:DNA-binding transcriptional regulator LsrR (DeoR family)
MQPQEHLVARIEELRLMAKVASLYYDNHMTQAGIATQLDLSQATISRLLKRAIEEEIVRISVTMPTGVFADLEDQVRSLYDLREVIVVDCENDDDVAVMRGLGSAAAFYIESTVKKHEVIGISSWSETLLSMVGQMHRLSQKADTEVIQILGGIGHPDAEVHAARLTERLARLVHGSAMFLPAPGIVGSADAHQIFVDDPYVTKVLKSFSRISLALVGIGTVEPSGLLASSGNIFSEEELHVLQDSGAVGDICLRFFDADGVPVQTPFNERVIGLDLPQIKVVNRAVGIAGGLRKREAIRGALRGGWINVLITDRCTAQWLVDGAC